MRAVSLFSGGLGLDLGLEPLGIEAVLYVEKDPDCVRLIRARRPETPVLDDVRKLDDALAATLAPVDLVAGGFPCQDLSYAGRGEGLRGERSGLWGEMARAVRLLRPRLVLVENVPGLDREMEVEADAGDPPRLEWRRGIEVVLSDLAEAGYVGRTLRLGAADVGAPHQRDRIFVLARASAPEPELGGVDADRGVRRRGQGTPRRPALQAVPPRPEVALAEDPVEDRPSAAPSDRRRDAPDPGSVARPATGERDRRPGAGGEPGERGRPREEVGGTPGRPGGGGEAPPDPGQDGRGRVETLFRTDGRVDVERGDDPDGRPLGDGGPRRGYAWEPAADPGGARREGSRRGLEGGRPEPPAGGEEPHAGGGPAAPPADAGREHGEPGGGRRASRGAHPRADQAERDRDRHARPAELGETGEAPPDPGSVGRDRRPRDVEGDVRAREETERGEGRDHPQDGARARDVEWGIYEPAVRRWERILGRPAPRPTDDRGRLEPAFVEWMLGYPAGWIDLPGLSRTAKLRILGNSVQVQCGTVAGAELILLDHERTEVKPTRLDTASAT